jgi:hypothetical protein
MDYRTFHRYQELAEQGKAKPLVCRECGSGLVVRLGKNDEPELQCFSCDTRTRPGLARYEEILAVVREHNV